MKKMIDRAKIPARKAIAAGKHEAMCPKKGGNKSAPKPAKGGTKGGY